MVKVAGIFTEKFVELKPKDISVYGIKQYWT